MKILRKINTHNTATIIVGIIIATFSIFSTFNAQVSAAPTPSIDCANNASVTGDFLGFPAWYKYLKLEPVAGKCTPMVDTSQGFKGYIPILVAVVEILLRLAGLIAVGFVVRGAFKYILSQGNPEDIKVARQIIINAVIGVVISIIASAIVSFFGKSLTTTSFNNGNLNKTVALVSSANRQGAHA
jgi:uncharacterized membrane protein